MSTSSDSATLALSYNTGEIHVKGAFTSELRIAARVSLQDAWGHQFMASQIMGKRPGMYLKYLPSRYHEVSGDMLTGGAYLFRTLEDAEEYERWTSNDLEVGEPKAKFWEQPLFESARHFSWKVVGACNFVPVDKHALGRSQRWTYDTEDAESLLHELYPQVKNAANTHGAASFWLLHRPADKMIAIQLTFPKPEGDGDESVREAMVSIAAKPSLSDYFPEALDTCLVFDRVSLYLALWLPLSGVDRGVNATCPNFPTLPTAAQNGE